MNTSSTTCAPWCTDHRGDLCASKTWTVASIRLHLYGCETDVPPVSASVRIGVPAAAYHPPELSRLSDALHAMAMLGQDVSSPGTDYWTGRLDALEDRERETAS